MNPFILFNAKQRILAYTRTGDKAKFLTDELNKLQADASLAKKQAEELIKLNPELVS